MVLPSFSYFIKSNCLGFQRDLSLWQGSRGLSPLGNSVAVFPVVVDVLNVVVVLKMLN